MDWNSKSKSRPRIEISRFSKREFVPLAALPPSIVWPATITRTVTEILKRLERERYGTLLKVSCQNISPQSLFGSLKGVNRSPGDYNVRGTFGQRVGPGRLVVWRERRPY